MVNGWRVIDGESHRVGIAPMRRVIKWGLREDELAEYL
jgi:hypothetical protein